MYKYETHLHTAPVSKCARGTVDESLKFYKELGYDGVFITNHFIDGNINIDRSLPYEDKINFYFSDYEYAKSIADEIGIKVFLGVEMSYGGTDFLIYGLNKEWYLRHPEMENMKKSDELKLLSESGALIIQAHPFREASYIDHIRLFPRHIHGVEIINAARSDAENELAKIYADAYGLLYFAGSDNHNAQKCKNLAGVCSESPITSIDDFIETVRSSKMQVFSLKNE